MTRMTPAEKQSFLAEPHVVHVAPQQWLAVDYGKTG